MSALLHAEALKLRTLRLTWVVVGLALALSGTIGFAGARIAQDAGDQVELSTVAAAPAQAMWFLGIVVAVVASAGEFQHRTIRTTLLAAPHRRAVLVGKSVVAAAFGAVLAALGSVVAVTAAWVTAALDSAPVEAGASWWHVAGAVAVGALWAVLATGIGILTRSTAIAVAAILLWRFVGEGILPVVTGNAEIVDWTPTALASEIVGIAPAHVGAATAGATLAAYTVAVCGLAALLFVRRDPT
jgi:ABC-2 type transport system permease protein